MSEIPSKLHIVAVGSSFAAGPGLQPLSNTDAKRSSVNYPSLLARSLGADLTDLTVSGATLSTLLRNDQVAGSTTFPPQISQIPSTADIVTLTSGGNDLQYIGTLMRQSAVGTAWIGPLLNLLLQCMLPTPDQAIPSDEELTSRFVQAIDAIHQAAPKARILLVTYLTCLGTHIKPGINTQLSQKQIEAAQSVAERLRQCYIKAHEQRSDVCELVDVSEGSKAHGIGSEEEWVCGFSVNMLWQGVAPFHPTYKGMEHVARRIQQVL